MKHILDENEMRIAVCEYIERRAAGVPTNFRDHDHDPAHRGTVWTVKFIRREGRTKAIVRQRWSDGKGTAP